MHVAAIAALDAFAVIWPACMLLIACVLNRTQKQQKHANCSMAADPACWHTMQQVEWHVTWSQNISQLYELCKSCTSASTLQHSRLLATSLATSHPSQFGSWHDEMSRLLAIATAIAASASTHEVLVHLAQQLHAVRLHHLLDALQQLPYLRRLQQQQQRRQEQQQQQRQQRQRIEVLQCSNT
jgi:hypothetical protein